MDQGQPLWHDRREAGAALALRLADLAGQGDHTSLVALPRGGVAHDAFSISRLGHVFNKLGDNLVAEFFFHGLAGVVVGECPTTVTDGAHIGERNLQRLGLGRRGCSSGRWGGSGLFFFAATDKCCTGNGRKGRYLQQGAFLKICHVTSLFR